MNNEQHSGSPIERGIGEERPLSFTKIMVFIALPVVSFIVSLFLGRLLINPIDVLKILGSKLLFIPFEHTWADTIETVVIRIRLPRAIMAMAVRISPLVERKRKSKRARMRFSRERCRLTPARLPASSAAPHSAPRL